MMRGLWLTLVLVGCAKAQSTDIFLLGGSDFVRPGTRANLSIGVGHTFKRLKGFTLGDEVIGTYTYENAGNHGFWHTDQGAHTEAIGFMRNVKLGSFGAYSSLELGITTLTGHGVDNRLYTGSGIGLTHSAGPHSSLWLQETYNKVMFSPWYTSTTFGYCFSF